MQSHAEEIWNVKVSVDPMLSWQKLDLGIVQFGQGETISLVEEVDGKSWLSVDLPRSRTSTSHKAEHVVKAFVALLEMKTGQTYSVHAGAAVPLQPKPSTGGWIAMQEMGPILVTTAVETNESDLTLFKKITGSLKDLSGDGREKVLYVLNSLHEAVTASSDVHGFLSIYASLNFMTSGIGKGATTVLSDAAALLEFVDRGILTASLAKSWLTTLHSLHNTHYLVLKENRVDTEKLTEIRSFLEAFLEKYVDYLLAGQETK